ncbi:unnamed protein product [Periconia digitata]|uniref:Uncharacterized protein n=1 Tax=Periconia digitata TaxID=1303443 RepID=A0A9W4UF64_9PLEO|nr:unnamed protein product [Periconia digitata]
MATQDSPHPTCSPERSRSRYSMTSTIRQVSDSRLQNCWCATTRALLRDLYVSPKYHSLGLAKLVIATSGYTITGMAAPRHRSGKLS